MPRWNLPNDAWLRRVLAVALVATIALLARPVERHARAAALLLRLAGEAPTWASLVESDFSVESLELAIEDGSPRRPREDGSPVAVRTARARLYRPHGDALAAPRGLVLAHGVHHLGIDEPRLVALARAFARAGVVVLTPELAKLAEYRVNDAENLGALRVAVRTLARDPEVRSGGVGLLGVSFAGGLALRVASDPALERDLAFVGSIGGHHDLTRVAEFFVRDRVATPDGEIAWKAHDYGLAVLVHAAPEKFVPEADAPRLRAAVRALLHESYGEAQQLALSLSPEAFRVFDRLAHRDRHALASEVLRALPAMEASMHDASPARRLASIRVPIFLLHGAFDDVVPPSESLWSAKEATGAPVHLLVTRKIGHAEMSNEQELGETLRLVSFMAALLDA